MESLSQERLQQSLPTGGLFADQSWLLSPRPLALPSKLIERIQRLGHLLDRFQNAQQELYQRSVKGSLPAWLHQSLDAGKPDWLIDAQRSPALREERPRVIRPDLLLQENQFAITELDSVPGGIGLTHWLNQTYAEAGWPVIGGAQGMLEGFGSLFPKRGGQILVSQESAAYRPEMHWLAQLLKQQGQAIKVQAAEQAQLEKGDFGYRFFELFDWENIPPAQQLIERAASGEIELQNPPRPLFEEKLWAAHLWLQPLKQAWELSTRRSRFQRLQQLIPRAWPMDPTPLPYLATHPQLEVHELTEVGSLSQKERQLILKISGYSEQAWGSRGVWVGADMPQAQWQKQINRALEQWPTQPHLLQTFAPTALIEHPYWNPKTGKLEQMQGRVRLCPYYFRGQDQSGADQSGEGQKLGGILATIVPADKKLIHGMKDGILCPVIAQET